MLISSVHFICLHYLCARVFSGKSGLLSWKALSAVRYRWRCCVSTMTSTLGCSVFGLRPDHGLLVQLMVTTGWHTVTYRGAWMLRRWFSSIELNGCSNWVCEVITPLSPKVTPRGLLWDTHLALLLRPAWFGWSCQ